MKLEQYIDEIVKFLKDYLENSPCENYVLGLSGGVDSSLVAALARKAVGKDRLFCYALPISSHHSDAIDAQKIAQQLDLNLKVVDLSKTYESFLNEIGGNEFNLLSRVNLKVRMRMCALYAYAQEHNALVLGTDNWDENYVGYFTKYGDGGVDILPIVRLTKAEVREAAKMLGLSDELANRTPSAGLFNGQTDEKEMGVLYDHLDAYLLGKEVDSSVKERIEHLHKISEHKRSPIPMAKPFKRD